MANTTSIDDIVNSIIESVNTAYSIIKTTISYSFLTAAGYLSYVVSGLAGPVTGIAMIVGRIILDLKKGIKTKWGNLWQEGIKGILLGNLTKLCYQYIINIIPNHTIYGKIGRTITFNPGYLGAVYHPTYLTTTKLFEGTKVEKGEWLNLVKKNTLLAPFHYVTTNYIENVQQQAAAAAILGTIYRVIAG